MTPLKTQDVQMLGIGLGKSIYSPEQIDEFIRLQESQGVAHSWQKVRSERTTADSEENGDPD
jgi:hypothetical protein